MATHDVALDVALAPSVISAAPCAEHDALAHCKHAHERSRPSTSGQQPISYVLSLGTQGRPYKLSGDDCIDVQSRACVLCDDAIRACSRFASDSDDALCTQSATVPAVVKLAPNDALWLRETLLSECSLPATGKHSTISHVAAYQPKCTLPRMCIGLDRAGMCCNCTRVCACPLVDRLFMEAEGIARFWKARYHQNVTLSCAAQYMLRRVPVINCSPDR